MISFVPSRFRASIGSSRSGRVPAGGVRRSGGGRQPKPSYSRRVESERGGRVVRVAVVQRPPVLLEREATLTAAVAQLHAAADAGANLVVFPETYVPGYPVWIWRLRPEADFELTSEIHRALMANSVDLIADGLQPMRDAAAERKLVVVCGLHERDGD